MNGYSKDKLYSSRKKEIAGSALSREELKYTIYSIQGTFTPQGK